VLSERLVAIKEHGMLLQDVRLGLRLELEKLLRRPLPLLRGSDIPLPLVERPAAVGPLLALDLPLLRGEVGLRLLRRRPGLHDHRPGQLRSLRQGRSGNGRELCLVSDGGGGGGSRFVGHL
jgi:hypothetical protein